MAEHKPYERSNAWESLEYKALGEAIETKFTEMKSMNDGEGLKSANKDVLKDFQTRNAELTDMREKWSLMRSADDAFQKQVAEHQKSFSTPNRKVPFAGAGGVEGEDVESFKSLGQRFIESRQYKGVQERGQWSNGTDRIDNVDIPGVSVKSLQDMALKTTMATTAGWTPYPTLSPRPLVMSIQIPPVVADLIPQDDTNQPVILWYEETTYTNNADAVAEGGAKPEAALETTLRQQPVVKIAVTLPVTDEQLMDVPQVRAYIDGRLTLMVRQKEQVELLRGSGVSPHLMGFHTKPNIGSLARGASEDNADAFLRAITEVNSITGLANATGVVMNPLQWLAIRLIRTTTGDYIWGHPSVVGPSTLWGLPVIATNAETDGLGLVGDFQMYSHISRRLGMRIDVGYINEDFKNDIQRIRLEERLSLEIYRAEAFCEVTNLNKAA